MGRAIAVGRGGGPILRSRHPVRIDPSREHVLHADRTGSMLYLRTLSNGWRTLAVVLATVAVLVIAVRWSSRGVVRAGVRAVIRERQVMLGIGLVASAAVVSARALQYAVLRWTPVGDAAEVIGTESPWVLPIVFFISSVLVIPAAGLVAASVAGVLTAGEDTDPLDGSSPPTGRTDDDRRRHDPDARTGRRILAAAARAGGLVDRRAYLVPPPQWWPRASACAPGSSEAPSC